METSDEELEWREWVQDAQNEDHKNRQRANRPFWEHFAGQLLKTSGQIFAIVIVILILLVLFVAMLIPHLPLT